MVCVICCLSIFLNPTKYINVRHAVKTPKVTKQESKRLLSINKDD